MGNNKVDAADRSTPAAIGKDKTDLGITDCRMQAIDHCGRLSATGGVVSNTQTVLTQYGYALPELGHRADVDRLTQINDRYLLRT